MWKLRSAWLLIVTLATLGCDRAPAPSNAETTVPAHTIAPTPTRSATTEKKTVATHGGLELRYRLRDEGHGDEMERVLEVIRRRVAALELNDVTVTKDGRDLVVRVLGDADEIHTLKSVIAPSGNVEIVLVADETDPFSTPPGKMPRGVRLEPEMVPLGPGKNASRHYAKLVLAKGESSEAALKRLKAWTKSLPLTAGQRFAFQRLGGFEVGWRTLVVRDSPSISGETLKDVEADENEYGAYVMLSLNQAGASAFEQLTAANVNRRLAIVFDGVVASAPQVREKIAGGRVQISMGNADGAELADAQNLARVLRSGALPSPLELVSENIVGPAR